MNPTTTATRPSQAARGIPAPGTETRPEGATVWLTGLSGAGKSTIASSLASALLAEGRPVEVLDGDELRQSVSKGLGFSREDRDTHVRRVGYIANLLSRNGVVTLVPVIAPYADSRDAVRGLHQASGSRYVEVHVSTPLEECRRRDVKGLYARRAVEGGPAMTGDGDPYEIPTHPDLRLDTTGRDLAETVATLRSALSAKGVL
ncbi:adenylyl-sulfate kinase [Actinomycetota bacterium]|nr:adenylyl-sulfate kinase [Micrococcales bacterium]